MIVDEVNKERKQKKRNKGGLIRVKLKTKANYIIVDRTKNGSLCPEIPHTIAHLMRSLTSLLIKSLICCELRTIAERGGIPC